MIERSCQSPADQALMLALARRSPAENAHIIDLPYRLSSWVLDEPGNTHLWFDPSGVLRAWAVMQTPFWAIDYALDPQGYADLHERVLDWGIERAIQLREDSTYGHPAWFVALLENQPGRAADLEAKGFADQTDVPNDPWSQVLMARPGSAAFAAKPLPPGYQLRQLNGLEEAAAYTDLHQAVFESRNMTAAWRARVIRQPAYHPELDLVIEAPDGSLAAFCIGWFDPVGYTGRPSGQIEPLGVCANQRGRGLAQALLAECFRRLRGMGADQIYVETNDRDAALALYEKVGFRVLERVHMFRRDF